MTVSPGNMNGWAFITESGTPTGTLVNGPGSPPAGTGSAEFTVLTSGDRLLLSTLNHNGLGLSEITTLSYSTYRQAGGSALAVSLQFDIDTDSTDANTSWMGRLVYEAYYTQTVLDNTWQTWNTMTTGANWWFSGAPGNATCSIGSPCTWAQVLTAFPNAAINGNTNLKGGGGWSGFIGNVDNLRLATQRFDTTYDFEAQNQVPEPSTLLLMSIGLAGLWAKRRRS
ncbi:MAG: PEP-CTERM sorting domain-containing protein [Candidatus Doudnabacteria bacterium]|nr:PEP-CTERM sorting domain-containing protein [Candidatus Doudnabacteria bacterium]